MVEATRTKCSLVPALGLAAALMGGWSCSGGLLQPPATEDELAELKRRMVALQRQTTVGEVELARLKQQIAQLEGDLKNAKEELKAAKAAEQAARAEAESTAAAVGRGTVAIEATELEDPESVDGAASTAGAAAASSSTPSQPLRPDAQRLYDEGYTLFHHKNYREAEERFTRFAQLYPTTELTDNALFWIGECRYARGEYNAALAAFTDTVARFPQGNKVADALLKAGKSLEALGDRERARETYAEVVDRFAGSEAAATAQERLVALR